MGACQIVLGNYPRSRRSSTKEQVMTRYRRTKIGPSAFKEICGWGWRIEDGITVSENTIPLRLR